MIAAWLWYHQMNSLQWGYIRIMISYCPVSWHKEITTTKVFNRLWMDCQTNPEYKLGVLYHNPDSLGFENCQENYQGQQGDKNLYVMYLRIVCWIFRYCNVNCLYCSPVGRQPILLESTKITLLSDISSNSAAGHNNYAVTLLVFGSVPVKHMHFVYSWW